MIKNTNDIINANASTINTINNRLCIFDVPEKKLVIASIIFLILDITKFNMPGKYISPIFLALKSKKPDITVIITALVFLEILFRRFSFLRESV